MTRKPKKPRPPLEVTLERFCFSGQTVCHTDSRKVLAWGGLPGERVLVREKKRKRGTSIGIVEQVLTPSDDRVEPLEDHFVCCSPWQVLDPAKEAETKRELVESWFAEEHGLQLPEFEVQGPTEVGYRNKLEFGFAIFDDYLSLSFFERGGPGRRVPLEGCCLGSDAINQAAALLMDRIRARGIERRSLKSLMLRSNRQGEAVAGLYVRDEVAPLLADLQGLEPLVGFRMYASNPKSPASVVDGVIQDLGEAEIKETLHGLEFSLSDRSFFQVNVPMFELALTRIRNWVPDDRPVIDIYAGVGTIGISLGRSDTRFIEIEPECTEKLKVNCERNGLERPVIITDPAEKALQEVPSEATVIVDPPRVGLHPKVVKVLGESQPDRIIYLSCNPDTQARDLVSLLESYDLIHFEAFNFFPRTPHLETLAVLKRKNS